MNPQYFCTMISFLSLAALPVAQASAEEAEREAEKKQYGHLKSHEPIFLGYTWDEDDVGYMDFKLSLEYPILHSGKPQSAALGFLPYPYFDFSGRFGHYIGTRASSPVIAKRYNPELFGRYWLKDIAGVKGDASLDIIYGHESNGQNVNDVDSYNAMALELAVDGDDPRNARDYISRGWDYAAVLWTQPWVATDATRIVTFTEVRYLLDEGLIQENAEEYREWENDREGKPRRKVDGLSFAYKYRFNSSHSWINSEKIYLEVRTGIEDTFRYNTLLAEASFTVGNIPLMLWVSHGYNSDLVDYYREMTSGGIAIEFMGTN